MGLDWGAAELAVLAQGLSWGQTKARGAEAPLPRWFTCTAVGRRPQFHTTWTLPRAAWASSWHGNWHPSEPVIEEGERETARKTGHTRQKPQHLLGPSVWSHSWSLPFYSVYQKQVTKATKLHRQGRELSPYPWKEKYQRIYEFILKPSPGTNTCNRKLGKH